MADLREFFPAGATVRDAEFATLGHADALRDGTLAYADTVSYVRRARGNAAITCLITTSALVAEAGDRLGVVAVANPRAEFYRIHELWVHSGRYCRPFVPHRGANCCIHPSAVVDPDCWIGDNTVIGEHAVVRGCVRIGSNVSIDPGVKLGMEGILYHRTETGMRLIPHGGWVSIGDGTALMTQSVVVRSVHDAEPTSIGSGCIIGLEAIVGHEADVADNVVVSNQCMLARRCRIGRGVFLGTASFVREHVRIGDGAQVMAGSVVIDDVAPRATVSGNFASDHKARMMELARMNKARRP